MRKLSGREECLRVEIGGHIVFSYVLRIFALGWGNAAGRKF